MDKDQGFWNKVIWSDEAEIDLFTSDSIQAIWRKKNSADENINTLLIVKHGGGSNMIYGCMSANDVETMQFVDGNTDKMSYLQILKDNVKQSAIKIGMPRATSFNRITIPNLLPNLTHTWLIWNVPKLFKTPPILIRSKICGQF